MNIFALPASLLVFLFTAAGASSAATGQPPSYSNGNTTALASTGSGSKYASACASATSSYSSAYSSWNLAHQWVENQTQVIGGDSWSLVTYYENGTTLCDGHARVPHTPAVLLSTATQTYSSPVITTEVTPLTYFSIYTGPSPTCSIEPLDCDGLWQAYSSSSSLWHDGNASDTLSAPSGQITSPPQTPPCMNQSAAAAWDAATSSIYGCGHCTIYGQGVELVYFPEPTTVSRDMCASTPLASETYYGDGAVIEAYAGTAYGRNASVSGGKATAVVGQNTFTSGTAYISIATVYAQDRCASTRGTPVYNAILAMPSESVLSLRYSQDHFKWAMVTATQTGFPISYADFNSPIPWSAWNGQAQCDNALGGYFSDVVYEDAYRPQLAIPPEINQLNAEWSDCQLWYGGLYDPPLALQPAESIALPTLPGQQEASRTAVPSSTAAAPTAPPTALSDEQGQSQPPSPQHSRTETTSADDRGPPAATWRSDKPATPSEKGQPHAAAGVPPVVFVANGQTWPASACGPHACIGPTTISANQPAQTLSDDVLASFGSAGLVIQGSTTLALSSPKPNTDSLQPSRQSAGAMATVITIASQPVTVTVLPNGAVAAVVGSSTLVPGGLASSLPGGQVLSAGDGGLVVAWRSTMPIGAAATSGTRPTGASPGSSAAGSGTAGNPPLQQATSTPTGAALPAALPSAASAVTGVATADAEAGPPGTGASGAAGSAAPTGRTSVAAAANRAPGHDMPLALAHAGIGLGIALVAVR
ncbi:hypothetical protein LTR36_004471 [Oleoguttula mirabilis]|uniref:Uncharacterized protein n=1 Tax=Oleoguttula mirabilis TaxID=1507867 RepID=A0AAV9JG08_9PEZI|nr:hypothetical protein LTR36_004471 [Oleoguttula mirabilis]